MGVLSNETLQQIVVVKQCQIDELLESVQAKDAEIAALKLELGRMRANHPEKGCYAALPKLRSQVDTLTHTNARLRDALKTIEAIICDKKLCGHFLAEEIREQTQQALADTDMKNQDLIRIACTWQFDDDDTDMAETECGHAFTFEDPDRAADWMKFCCYCGKPVELLRPEDIDEVNK